MTLTGLAAVLAAVICDAVRAQAWDHKRITRSSADSSCIGDVSSPVCAVETWIACHAREAPKLCALLGVTGMKFVPFGTANVFDYAIVAMRPVTADRITAGMRRWGLVRPGQMEVRVMERWCSSDCDAIDKDYSFGPSVYFLKREGDAWRLAAWTNDVSVTCYYSDADTPPCKLYFHDRDTPWVHDRSLYLKYR